MPDGRLPYGDALYSFERHNIGVSGKEMTKREDHFICSVTKAPVPQIEIS